MLHQKWQALFEECFQRQYALIHRLETNKLRNVAKFFAHLLHTDAVSWAVLCDIRLTEDDTTSSSRIFIKILFQVPPAASRLNFCGSGSCHTPSLLRIQARRVGFCLKLPACGLE